MSNYTTFDLPASQRGWIRRLHKACSGLLAAGLLATAVSAQTPETGVVRGRVLNASSGKYLGNARVVVAGTNLETMTNDFGEYVLHNVPVGPATIRVMYSGMQPVTSTTTVTAGAVSTQDLQFSLSPDEADMIVLDTFVVASKREYNAAALAINEQRNSANLKNVVSTDAYGEISQGNIGEFLKHVPGVTVEYNGNSASGIQVRGFNSNYTMVTLDGGQLASSGSSIATQNHSRQYYVDQTSINNLSRIEVSKLPTPDMAANLMGGAVNLVSKSAFEYARPELTFATYLSMNSDAMDFKKSPGPGEDRTFKVRPSGRVSYALPVNSKFGVVVTASSANEYYRTRTSTITRTYTNPVATAETGPQFARTTGFSVKDAPSTTDRAASSIKMDWKPLENHILSFTVSGSANTGESTTRSVSYKTGNVPTAWGENFTTGAATGGSANQIISFKETGGTTVQGILGYRFTGKVWQIDAAGNYSRSRTYQRDIGRGGFGTLNTSTPVASVSFDGIDNDEGSPGTVTARDSAGQALAIDNLSTHRLTTVSGSSTDAQDTVREARINASRLLETLPFYLKLKGGVAMNELRREIDYYTSDWTYVGPDGVQNNADNSMEGFIDSRYSTVAPGLGYSSTQYASPWLVYRMYQAHPEYFIQTASQVSNVKKNAATRSPIMKETVTAGYLMGDSKFLDNRIRVVAGARYEKTKDEGRGYLQTLTGYVRRGTYVSRDYDGIYPSGHITVNLTDDLLLRAAYANTIGRPRPADIVPNLYVGANTGTTSPDLGWVTSNNTELKPWSADNYDVSLEYYLPRNGVVSAGVFRKDIKDFFGKVSRIVDEQMVAELGLGAEAIGYTYSSRINAGDARIAGIELNYSQSLLKNLSVFSNFTYMDLDGERQSEFSDFIPKTANAGLSWNFWKMFGVLKANYRGKQLRETKNSSYAGAAEYIRSRVMIDMDIEYQMTKHFALFVSAANITNESYEWEVSGAGLPSWAKLTSYNEYGAQYTFGVKGTF